MKLLDLLIVLIVFIVLFGTKRLPDAGKGLGEAIRNFKEGLKGDRDKDDEKKQS
ncbi:MAG: twin-arginine translocase TatA/TatE family subunit [Bryobacteraceae bacterium]|jgi:sec-independent protein translocase protein TatA